jgi:hypothetical protein
MTLLMKIADHGPELGWNHERVTRIELTLSTWEFMQSGPLRGLTCEAGCP